MKKKTPRENLLSLLKKQGYDEAPLEFMLCPSQIEQFHTKESASEDYMSYFNMPWQWLPYLVPDDDFTQQYIEYHKAVRLRADEIDEWGVGHRATPTSMHMTQMYNPLKDAESVEEIKAYPLPVYSDKNNSNLKKQTEELHSKGIASVGSMQCTVWERSWYIRGMENLMMDMMSDDEIPTCLFDRITEMSIQCASLYAKAGVDILFLGDDVGMQQSLMMSEELYVTWLKPRLKLVIDAARAVKPDIIVFYHSCGFVEPLIPHLIDAGIDVLSPIQPECMDFEEIFYKYGDKLSFHGTIGTQSVLPFGTPADVKAQVKRHLDISGEKGGLFVAPTHLVEPEVPWENILAYVQACREYKK